MDWPETVVSCFKQNGINTVAYVPDFVLSRLIKLLEKDRSFVTICATREEEGLGILTGAYLGKGKCAMLMQSSGFGNCLNALASLCIPYQIPFLMLITMRGEIDEFNSVQVSLARAMRRILDALGISHFTLERKQDIATILGGAIKTAHANTQPVAVLLSRLLTGGKDE